MKKITQSIITGGITAVGVVTAAYRAYKIKKIQEEIEKQQIIDIEPTEETPQK